MHGSGNWILSKCQIKLITEFNKLKFRLHDFAGYSQVSRKTITECTG